MGDCICARYLHLEFLTDFGGICNGESAPKSFRQVSVWPASVECNPCFTRTKSINHEFSEDIWLLYAIAVRYEI